MKPQRCQVLHGFELSSCRGVAEGMDKNGVLVCRACGKGRVMEGGLYVGWFEDQPARDEESRRFWKRENARLDQRIAKAAKPRPEETP